MVVVVMMMMAGYGLHNSSPDEDEAYSVPLSPAVNWSWS